MQLIYGTQYYRPPAPAAADWERDLRLIKDHGFNVVKIWAMWSFINKHESGFDFADLDRLLDLAGRFDLKVIMNIILENAPYWLAERYPEARYLSQQLEPLDLMARPNTPGGGWPGLCLDNEPVKEAAARFIRALGARYLNHPALYAYDVWNETFFECNAYFQDKHFCYCPATARRFVTWLQERYGTLEALAEAWSRPYTDWEQVHPPRYLGGYPDWHDWIGFRLRNQADFLRWRVETLRQVDVSHPAISHGIVGSLDKLPVLFNDDWFMAEEVEVWGLTTFPYWGDDHPRVSTPDTPWNHALLIDLVRAAAKGKPITQSELQGGHVQSGNESNPMGIIRSKTPDIGDYAIWNWTALMGGCRGIMYWQWRPELLGPEAPGFGLTEPDGSANQRTAAAGQFAEMLLSHDELGEMAPAKSKIAICMLRESQIHNYLAEGNTVFYGQSVKGIYKALWETGIWPDFTDLQEISGYPCVYLPFPLMLTETAIDLLARYVEAGGVLLSEAEPGFFGDRGRCRFSRPWSRLAQVFGVEWGRVESCDQDDDEAILFEASMLTPVLHRQAFRSNGARTIAAYRSGEPAITRHTYGGGTAVLIGTFPGMAYYRGEKGYGQLISRLAAMFGIAPEIAVDRPEIAARMHEGREGKKALYLLNYKDGSRSGEIKVKHPSGSEWVFPYRLSGYEGKALTFRVEDGQLLKDSIKTIVLGGTPKWSLKNGLIRSQDPAARESPD